MSVACQGCEPIKECAFRKIDGSTYGRVNFVHAETRIQVRERRDGGSHPGRRERCTGTNVRSVVGVEYLHLVTD
jgi:hypothetical protein